jgi:hypothetical protein
MSKSRLPRGKNAGLLAIAPAAALLMLTAPARAQPADTMNLDNPWDPAQPMNSPVGPWHELWPNYCAMWDCFDWVDNGNGYLDFCDYVLLGQPFAAPTWWHVEAVTVTVFFDETIPPMPQEPPVMDFGGPLPIPPDWNPIGPWHEVWPNYCEPWQCIDWIDSNANGIVDFCDWLIMEGPHGLFEMHVAEVGTDITVTREDPPDPPRKWLDNPGFFPYEPIPDPTGPWHELYPTYCRDWVVTDWQDNGNGELDVCDYIQIQDDLSAPTWWHVANLTITVWFDQGPAEAPALDWEGPWPPIDTEFPVGFWHEVWPQFCRPWECISWIDNGNGVVDPCDFLEFIDPDMNLILLHVAEVATDLEVVREDPPPPDLKWLDRTDLNPFEPIPDPLGPWHELHPTFCNWWECIDWVDNGNGELDYCDFILLDDPAAPAPEWWHVETVTVTVFGSPLPGGIDLYLDWAGPFPVDPFNPIGPWHEIYPTFCKNWDCQGWNDTQGNGILDFCDELFIVNPDDPTEQMWIHVEDVGADIEIAKVDPDHKWLDNPALNPFEPIYDPLGQWHELWPVFCWWWDVVDWIDNGNNYLDHCDYIFMGQAGAHPEWWHVETVTVTALVTPQHPDFPPMYLDWVGPGMTDPFDPVGPWHEVYPNHCTPWICEFWEDNGNGILDFCDNLLVYNPDTGDQFWAHVEEVATDIEIVRQDPPRMWLDGLEWEPYWPIPDPRGVWHELWPEYCPLWLCMGWIDNTDGILSVCDYLWFAPGGEPPSWWHVENVTVTVEFDEVDPPHVPPVYMDWLGPVPSDPFDFWPIGPWHEIYPNFCMPWNAMEWHDTGMVEGIVDECDWICFEDPFNPPELACMHVANVAWDIEVLQRRPPCPWDCAWPPDGLVNILDFLTVLAQWGGPGSCDIDGNGVVNINDFLLMLAWWGPCP